jgi:septum formation protein
MQIILASDSPRRKHLLKFLVEDFQAVSHKVYEANFKIKDPEELVGQLAIAKAQSIDPPVGGWVIGSDLTVVLKDKIMGKPRDKEEAGQFLKLLSGKIHTVYCAIAVASKDKVLMSVARAQVLMKKYDNKIIEKYINKFHVLDKGGAYAIQFKLPDFGSLVKSFEGGITTIIGLPLHHLENLLKEFGVAVNPDWPQRCKIETGYEY